MKSYKDRIIECIDYLLSIRYPCDDWKEDKIYFDGLEKEFSDIPTDAETKKLFDQLHKLIYEKRVTSLNGNKTTEELFAGWNED